MKTSYNQKLRYPNKSHRKLIRLPSESSEFAEFMGIVFGDGGISNNWQLVISLNSISDRNYAIYIMDLSKRLFHLQVTSFIRKNEDCLKLVFSSLSLVEFLVKKGLLRGNKILQNIDMPNWIDTDSLKKGFVRGLVDTDGCLYVHTHIVKGKTYNNIGFCFTSYSRPLLDSTANILKEFSIKPPIHKSYKRLYLYGEKAIARYLEVIGSSNERIYNTYNTWRDSRAV